MSELRNNANFEEEAQNPKCTGCKVFYGDKAKEGMCSKCYRDFLDKAKSSNVQATNLLSQATSLSNHLHNKFGAADVDIKAPVEEAKVEKVEVKEEKVETQETKEEPSNKQKDHTRCFQCNKKVGLLGFKCQCDSTFCRNHRLPEAHVCDFDFTKVGKERLARENIQVKADKVERL